MSIYHERLPPCSLLRNERTNKIYFVFKVDRLHGGDAHYLCCVYDPSENNQTLPLTFHYITDYRNIYKYTILNTTVKEEKDGTIYHLLNYLDYEEVLFYKDNIDFMTRYITTCFQFIKNKKIFTVSSVSRENKTVDIKRKSTWLEKLIFKPTFLTFRITWLSLLEDYMPYLPPNVDEVKYMETVKKNVFF